MTESVEGIGWRYEIPRFNGRAACAETDPEEFYPDRGASTRQAKRVCKGCEVQTECLAWALEHVEQGVWGGMTERQRRRLSARRKPQELPISHGTEGGYRTHLRRGDSPCLPCSQAQTLATAARKQRRDGAA